MPQDDALIAELTSPTYGQQVLGVEALKGLGIHSRR